MSAPDESLFGKAITSFGHLPCTAPNDIPGRTPSNPAAESVEFDFPPLPQPPSATAPRQPHAISTQKREPTETSPSTLD
jgi:hypothetical protein